MKRWQRVAASIVMVGVLGGGTIACGKEIDTTATGAQLVPGTNDLWWFCHETTLIYIEKYEASEDSYEAFFANGCTPDGRISVWADFQSEGQGNEEK